MQKMIPLKNLRFGEEHDPPLNVRKTGRDVDIPELAASIDANGMGQALNVVEQKGLGFVEDGNRRLRALRLLEKQGNLTDATMIKCEISEKEGLKTGELGLALNTQRVAMHPADFYEAVKDQHKQGRTEKEIADRTGWPLKDVRQMLALGALSPVVLDAWREGKEGGFAHRAYDTAAAFTLAPSLKDQEKVFARLKKSRDLNAHTIRDAFGAGNQEGERNISFIGAAAYRAAGGIVVKDLFGDNDTLSDPALAAKLARAKLIAEGAKLKGAGWAWAELISEMPQGWQGWTRVGGGEKAKADDKAKAGCVVSINHEGKLQITYGMIQPEKVKAAPPSAAPGAKPTATKAAPDGPARLSESLKHDLDIMAASATVAALKAEDPASPLTGVLALVVAAQIDTVRGYHTPSPVRNKLEAIRDAITIPVMDGALKKAFGPERYFKNAPKEFVVKAIKEACGDLAAKTMGPRTKSATWHYALEHVVKTGWLPPELRTAHYSGPGAKKTVEKKPTKVPTKKATKARAAKIAEPA